MNQQGNTFQLMGILNVTPDSFSDGGRFNTLEAAIEQAKKMEAEGAAWIDVSGESTRPGHAAVSLEEELERVIPAIRRLAKAVKTPLSVDTYKAEVTRRALEEGASMVNDIWGLKADPEMANVVARYRVPVVVMHNRRAGAGAYRSLIEDIIADLMASVALAKSGGVDNRQIILDPGIGFAKDYRQNMEVMRQLDKIAALGYPLLLGASRKSFIGNTLDLNVDERLEGTLASAAIGFMKGCRMFRVHDCLAHQRFLKMFSALTDTCEGR